MKIIGTHSDDIRSVITGSASYEIPSALGQDLEAAPFAKMVVNSNGAYQNDYILTKSVDYYLKDGEIFLVNSHIPQYKQASYSNHNPYSERKLLLSRKEINKLTGRINEDGFSLVPTKMYFKKGIAKIEIALAKGKKLHDKRQTKKTRDWNREKARYFRKSS